MKKLAPTAGKMPKLMMPEIQQMVPAYTRKVRLYRISKNWARVSDRVSRKR